MNWLNSPEWTLVESYFGETEVLYVWPWEVRLAESINDKKKCDLKFERFKSKREKDMGKQIGKNRRKEKIEDKEKEEK